MFFIENQEILKFSQMSLFSDSSLTLAREIKRVSDSQGSLIITSYNDTNGELEVKQTQHK